MYEFLPIGESKAKIVQFISEDIKKQVRYLRKALFAGYDSNFVLFSKNVVSYIGLDVKYYAM